MHTLKGACMFWFAAKYLKKSCGRRFRKNRKSALVECLRQIRDQILDVLKTNAERATRFSQRWRYSQKIA